MGPSSVATSKGQDHQVVSVAELSFFKQQGKMETSFTTTATKKTGKLYHHQKVGTFDIGSTETMADRKIHLSGNYITWTK
jgi:hypothetical protein